MKYVVIGITALMLASCASVNSVDEVRVLALNAESAAKRAENKATAAAELSKETSEKLDRLYKQSMMK